MKEQEIYIEALSRSDPRERSRYLDQACADDHNLRERLEVLFQHSQQVESFLEQPAAPMAEAADILLELQPMEGSILGPYKLREQIGEGGMGVVYVAEQSEPVKRKVALKIIKPGMASHNVVARFEAERQALALMNHPNIARVFDGGATNMGHPYFVMELVQGPPINEYCDQHKLNTIERLELFEQVCSAVQHAHRRGIIHRDLKPSNVLVARIDGTASPKVIDFGVAKAVDHSLTEATVYTQFCQMVGTPLYMSPEQAELGVVDIDTRSDVYSLGVLLYELITGSTPFDNEKMRQAGFDEMRRIIREDDPPRPSVRISTLAAEELSTVAEHRCIDSRHLHESLKGELDWIVMKALEKDRGSRYESPRELAEDLKRYRLGDQVSACPPTVGYRFRKFASRNRTLVFSTCAILTALVVGLLIASAGLLHAIAQRERALESERISELRLAQVTEEQENNQALIDLFYDIYPRDFGLKSRGLNHTVYDSVEELSGELDKGRLKKYPSVEIEVRQAFADSYTSAGEFEKARRHLYRALELAEEFYGEQNIATAGIHATLADEKGWNPSMLPSEVERTMRHARKAIEIYEALGIKDPKPWFALSSSLINYPERFDEALAAQRKCVEFSGEGSVIPLMDLGLTLQFHKDDRLEEAYSYIDRALANYRRSGVDKPHIEASVLAARGKCLRWMGRLPEAIEAYQEAWNTYSQPSLLDESWGHQIGYRLAELEFAANRIDKAFLLLLEIQKLAKEHHVVESQVQCQSQLGWLYFQVADYEQAEEALREAVKLASQQSGKMHANYGHAAILLARTYEALGRSGDASEIYAELMPLTGTFVNAGDIYPIVYWAHARGILLSCGDDSTSLEKAESIVNQAYANVQEYRRKSEESCFHLLRSIIHYRRGQVEQAINELNVGLEKAPEPKATIRTAFKYLPSSRCELETTLADYLVEAGRPEEATEIHKNAVAMRLDTEGLGPNHIQTSLAKLRFGAFLRSRGKYSQEREQLVEVYQLLPDTPLVRGVRQRVAEEIADCCDALQDAEEAASWRAQIQTLID